MTKTTIAENGILDLILRNGASSGNFFVTSGLIDVGTGAGSTNLYLSLHTAYLGEAPASGQNTSETTYGTYSRLTIPRVAANWDALGSGVYANGDTSTFTFAAVGSTNSVQTLTHWAIGTSASDSGEVIYSGPLASADPQPFIVNPTGSNAVTNRIQSIAHGYASNDSVMLLSYPNATFPSTATSNVRYYVVSPFADKFGISATQGGAAIAVGSGEGTVVQVSVQVTAQNNTPRFVTNALRITED